jgi:hypothetical protein
VNQFAVNDDVVSTRAWRIVKSLSISLDFTIRAVEGREATSAAAPLLIGRCSTGFAFLSNQALSEAQQLWFTRGHLLQSSLRRARNRWELDRGERGKLTTGEPTDADVRIINQVNAYRVFGKNR